MKKISLLLLVVFSLTGCISATGQYRGVANGVEIKTSTDGGTVINVSGGAAVIVGSDGSITARSESSTESILELLK